MACLAILRANVSEQNQRREKKKKKKTIKLEKRKLKLANKADNLHQIDPVNATAGLLEAFTQPRMASAGLLDAVHRN